MTTIIPIKDILVKAGRQRQSFPEQEMLELRDSIVEGEGGLLSPILVRENKGDEEGDQPYILVAGERRLRTVDTIKEPYRFSAEEVPPHHIPAVVTNFESEIGAEEAELHENIYRVNLTWQEKALAISRLHKFKVSQNPKHSKGMTAKIIEPNSDGDYAGPTAYRHVQQALLVENYMDDKDVQRAKSLGDASRVVSRKLEEEALNMLSKKALAKLENTPALELDEGEGQGKGERQGQLDLDLPALNPNLGKVFNGEFYEGNCLEIMDTFESNSVDLVVADPPYGVGADKFKYEQPAGAKHKYDDSEEDVMMTYFKTIAQLSRICKEHAHIYLFCDMRFFVEIASFFPSDWKVRPAPLIWRKGPQGVLSEGVGNGWTRTYETILVAKRGSKLYSKILGDVIDVPRVTNKQHGAEKPVDLYCKLLEMSGMPEDVVLDPFAGSGTVYEAAYRMMMKPIGIELNPMYAQLCRERMKG